MNTLQKTSFLAPRFIRLVNMSTSQLGDMGSGAGKGGGGGGSIREAGGAFGKMEAAREEEYFYKKSKEQLERLRANMDNLKEYYEQKIQDHKQAIERYEKRLYDLKN